MKSRTPNDDEARLRAITSLPEAAGRKGVAEHLARFTDFSIEQARDCLVSCNVDDGELGSAIAAGYLADRGLQPKVPVIAAFPDFAGMSSEEAEAARVVTAFRNMQEGLGR